MFSSSANEDFKVDERVINIVRDSYAEDKSNADDPRPKSSSFMARSGSFTTKGKDKGTVKSNDEKEKDNSKDERSFQQFNKNVSSLFVLLTIGSLSYTFSSRKGDFHKQVNLQKVRVRVNTLPTKKTHFSDGQYRWAKSPAHQFTQCSTLNETLTCTCCVCD